MANKNKGAIVVIFSLVLIGGGVGYWLWKRKKDKTAESDAKAKAEADLKLSENNPTVQKELEKIPKEQPKPIKPADLPPPKSKVKVKTIDLLAGDINGANGKKIYSIYGGLPIYNMKNIISYKTQKNKYLGTVVSATASGTTYKVIIKGDSGVLYWGVASGTVIEM